MCLEFCNLNEVNVFLNIFWQLNFLASCHEQKQFFTT